MYVDLKKIFISLFCVSILVGCNAAEVDMLRVQNIQLKKDLAKETSVKQIYFDRIDRQAGIAAGCDYISSICPDSIVQEGRYFIEHGYSGGSSIWFWLVVFLKVTIASVTLGIFLATIRYMQTWLCSPAEEEVLRAKQLILDALKQEKEFSAKKKIFEEAIKTLVEDEEAMHDYLCDLDLIVDEKEAIVNGLEEAILQLEREKAAFSSFAEIGKIV